MSLRPAHPLSTSPRAFNKSETYREAPLEGGRTYLQETAAKNRTVKRKAKKTQQWKNLGWKRRGGRERMNLSTSPVACGACGSIVARAPGENGVAKKWKQAPFGVPPPLLQKGV
ncbi:hypothetical protein NPIL_36701 [Nephila pilipes]|uniref:Uncharacterized protein n=1 Tax=Nephila pilipes TaxID=299642 RepID=A0A8X6UBP4_NEPPI|nr:hypothetical protein NPIL_387251 [Nephila pilipes]GFU13970.1 hypothetical protein NPIL_36701 [Nephila pilipes]